MEPDNDFEMEDAEYEESSDVIDDDFSDSEEGNSEIEDETGELRAESESEN